MKYLLWMILIVTISNSIYAQLTKTQRIQDSIVGWDVKNYYDRNYKPQTTEEGKQKEAIMAKMADWLKASYTPVGGIGEYQRYVGKYGYGLDFQVWNVGYDYLDAQKKFRPIPEEFTPAHFAVNKIFNSYDIDFMNKKGEWFFTMQPNGYAANSSVEKSRNGMDKKVDVNVSKYITWVADWVTIYIAPDNQLLIKPVSKGELLDKALASLDGVFEDRKKDEAQRWQNNTKGYDEAIAYAKKEIDKYRDNMQKLKEKYKSSLNEQAFVADMQTDWRSFSADSWDIFQKGPNTIYYPVYKLDAETLTKMNNAKPLWLAVAIPYASKNDGIQKYEFYTSITQNINYDYIYKYFFAPEKVAGKIYVPANEDQLKARLAVYKNTSDAKENIAATKQSSLPANVVLFDDFSQEVVGNKPGGWYFNNIGETNIVSTVDGMNGQWLKLGYNNPITSTILKTFPQNFMLEFDLVTDKFDGNWGTSLQLLLYGKTKGSDGIDYASSIEMNITAGLQSALDAGYNYRGDLRIKLLNKPSKMEYNDQGGYFNYAQPEFTSTKSKVHIQLEKKGIDFFVYLNNKQVAASTSFKTMYGKDCGDCSISSTVNYTKFSMQNLTQDADNIGCYISNIKITKE